MISVLNRRQLLNGSKLCLIALLFLTSCSPKIAPVKNNKPTAENADAAKPAEKPRKFATANLILLLPFELKQNNVQLNKADVEQAEMAIDFYQGFMLGVDSAAVTGQNFKVNVIDSKGSSQPMAGLLKQDALQNANLVIGPVFPESLKQLNRAAGDLYFISPLAATMPDEFNNPRLISLIPNIRLHAEKMAGYIKKKYKPESTIIVLINPKNAESEVLGAKIRELFAGDAKINFQEYTTVNALETKFQKNKQYVVLISSPEREFVVQSIDKLAKIKKRLGYLIDLYGHPDWSKQNYNNTQLQELNTCITSSYRINYKRTVVINFIKKYRETYTLEPSEFAFKGFDTGLYFAKLLAKYGPDYITHLTKEKFMGLQNNYSFYKDDHLGYINTDLMLLRYKNFNWGVVE